MNAIVSFIDQIFITASSYPLVIQIAIFFIFANSILGLILFFNMIRIRRNKRKTEKRLEDVLGKSESLFLDILLDEEELEPYEVIERYEEKVERLTQKSIDSAVYALENVIIQNRDLRRSQNFMAIVQGFDMLNYLEDNIDAFSTKKRLGIFQTLANLELTVSDSKILPHTYSRDKSIKKESRASYIAVSKNDPFKFFEANRESALNEWDMISLMQQFELHHKENLPDFSKWIKYAKQKTQIIFFIRMTAHFNQTNSIDTIADLLNDEDHDIRREAILSLGKLNFTQIEAKLMRIYYSQPEICQRAIIHTITLFQTGLAYEFLRDAYETAGSVDTKLLLAEALYLYEPQGLKYFNEKIQHEEGFGKLILQHVENPLIKSELRESLENHGKIKREGAKRQLSLGSSNTYKLKPVLKN